MRNPRYRIHALLFRTSTPSGKRFNIILLALIVLSVFVVIMESIPSLQKQHAELFIDVEWFFTLVFTVEYLLRILTHPRPWKYATSILGIIDLLAILPTYIGLFYDQTNFLLVVRAFRLLRVFRILKLTRYITEANQLAVAMRMSFRKIVVFFEVVLILVLFMGTIMYMVEGEINGFNSIPQSIYWAIVTITTVGYGDIAPATVAGKIIASLAMLTGYSIIAVPTGIITVEIGKLSGKRGKNENQSCVNCGHVSTDQEDNYCSRCGTMFP